MTDMMDALLAAGRRLAEALRAENEALAALDLPRAAGLTPAKLQATDAFAAACAAAAKTGTRAAGPVRDDAMALTTRLQALGEENRRLLQRAIAIQSQVIETIAGAALPRQAGPGYGAAGRPPAARRVPALAMATRV
ncbi:hypothetical protein [Paracraurococcus lichenis]|uniref:Flagellar protein FlgN n=1 Tax=Paracraurococcus lichenis TaxID=3064888 RepID=A0ABT9E4P4_9PROT|nr:hypothetical protein [Paracraurococcus sp. LOR1-02]MDO9711145.1 hypothetical protein [Paracraurococcus sp. LOR1-02]